MKTVTIISIFILTLTQGLASQFQRDLRDSIGAKDSSRRTSAHLENPWYDLENKIYLTLKPIMRKAHPHRIMGETVMEFLETLNNTKSTPIPQDAPPVPNDKDKDFAEFASLLNLFQVLKNIEKFDPNCPKSTPSAEAYVNPKNITGFLTHLKSDTALLDTMFQKLLDSKTIPAVPDDHLVVVGTYYQSSPPKFSNGQMQILNRSQKHPQYELVGKVIKESLEAFDQNLTKVFEESIPKHIFYKPLDFLRLQLLIHWTGLNYLERRDESFNFFFYPAVSMRYQRIPGEIPPSSTDLPDDLFKFHRLERQNIPQAITWKMTQKIVGFGLSSHVNQDMLPALRTRVTALQKYLERKANSPLNDQLSPMSILIDYLDTMQISYGLSFGLDGTPLDAGPDAFFASLKADFDETYTLKQKIDQEAYRLGTLLLEKHPEFLRQKALTTWFFNPIK